MLRGGTILLAGLALASPVLLIPTAAAAAPSTRAASAPAAGPGAGPAAAEPYDFDGDGRPDLVVGADALRVDGVKRAGGVFVLSGTDRGPAGRAKVLTQSSAHVPGIPRTGYRFGAAFTSADFDSDGYADLAVGTPADAVGDDEEEAGSVTVLFGSPTGLSGRRSYVLTRAGAATDDGFGAALASADLDGDGEPDLVVGAPYIDQSDEPGADEDASGSVTVFHATDGRFSAAHSTVLRGVLGGSAPDDGFGSTLALGDVDGQTGQDLVVGSRGTPFVDGSGHAGAVTICPAATSCTQLTAQRSYAGLQSLAVGNVSGSARSEIVLGVAPGPDAGRPSAGSVVTLSLSGRGGQTSARAETLTQDSPGVPGKDERGDAFGSAVALGDLDEDGHADVVVGSPGEAIGRHRSAGRVTVVYGGRTGYRSSGSKAFAQNTRNMPGTPERGDEFGSALALADLHADGHLDLVAGAPGENGSGVVTTFHGTGHRLDARGSRAQSLKTLRYARRAGARFGDSVAG